MIEGKDESLLAIYHTLTPVITDQLNHSTMFLFHITIQSKGNKQDADCIWELKAMQSMFIGISLITA